jgi:putative sterol carrier protein
MALFATEEWAQALADEMNADKEMAKAGKGFDATIQFVIQNAGDRGDIPFWTHLKDGKVLELGTGEKKCDYVIAGDYGVWKEIVEGNQDPLQAIMVKKLTFEGNMQIIMKYIKAVNQMMEDVKKIPTEF